MTLHDDSASVRSGRCRNALGRRAGSSRSSCVRLRRIIRGSRAERRREHGADAIGEARCGRVDSTSDPAECPAESAARDFTSISGLESDRTWLARRSFTTGAAAAGAKTKQRHRAGRIGRRQQERRRVARHSCQTRRLTEDRRRVAEAHGCTARSQQQRALSARTVAVENAAEQRQLGSRRESERRCSGRSSGLSAAGGS